MNSSTSRRDRIVVYTLAAILTTSFLGLCMLMLAAGLYLIKGGFDKRVAAHQIPVLEQPTTRPVVAAPVSPAPEVTPVLPVHSTRNDLAVSEMAAALPANPPTVKPTGSEPKTPATLNYSRMIDKKLAEGRARAEAARLARQEKEANTIGTIEFQPNRSADTSKKNDESGELLSIKELPASSNLDQLQVNPPGAAADRSEADVAILKVDVEPTNDSGSIRQFRSGGWGYNGLAFTPNAAELVALGNDNVSVFDVRTGRSAVYKLVDREARARSCAMISPDGKRLFAGTQGGYVLVWKMTPGQPIVPEYRYKIDEKEVQAIALSPDNKHVVTAHSGGNAFLWELATGDIIATCRDFHFGSTAAAQFSGRGDQALICDTRNAVVLDVRKLKLVQRMELTRSSGQSIAISPGAQRISAGKTYDMHTWDTSTGQPLAVCEGKNVQWCAAYSPNGEQLATGDSGKITLWDVQTGQILNEMTMSESGYVKYVAFSPDGLHCAAIGAPIGALVEVFRLPQSEQGQ